jgi:hypothetical protein
MNWDYVSGKEKKINKNKGTKRGKTKIKQIHDLFIRLWFLY